jgi:hypothetical protein
VEGTPVSSLRVVVCDDDDDRAGDWADRINQATTGVEAVALDSDRFAAAVGALKERKAYAKQHGELPTAADDAGVFDESDVAVLDSDLTPDSGSDPASKLVQQHLVGELGGEVAHLARCYSSAKALMVVNQKWKRRSFDLTLLTFASDVAEVYVSETDLDNRGLWSTPAADGTFRPWSWPILTQVSSSIEDLCAEIALDQPVLESLGLQNPAIAGALTNRQLDALGVEEPDSMTFDTVATESNFGLRLKETVQEEQRLRIGVYGVRRWLDRYVLPAHNVLIDSPHLLQRRPWSVVDRDDLASWNDAVDWFVAGTDRPRVDPSPDAYAETTSRWLGRHVWLWPIASRDQRAGDQRVLPTDPVFCEDTSTFVDPTTAKDFISDLEGPTGQRFVQALGDVDYHPRRRLLT